MSTATITATGMPRIMTTWSKLGLAATVIGAAYWGLSFIDYERYLFPTVLMDWLRDAGPLAPLLLIGSMACAVIIPPIPSLPLDLVAGAVFGPFYGALYAIIGAEIGAIGCFLLGRALGRDALSKLLRTEATFCQMCTDHQLMGLMFVARLIPVFSFDVVSYGAGLTNISLKSFALATLFGMAPPTFALTYFGSSIVSAQWPLMAAGVVMVIFFLAMPKLLIKYRTSPLASLLLGPPPATITVKRGISLQVRCVGCGAAIPMPVPD
ncbi:MAG TPA: TVP38/TMEM64 family protein [Nitrospira sp.]|nr:TVP38/TMEM64 family protein [Nitrospira sp.]